jgi:predicted nucleic acid-binding protein
MTPTFVLDASMALSWCFEEEAGEISKELFDRMERETALIPAWWFLEITNVLAIAQRKGRLDSFQVSSFIETVDLLSLEVDNEAPNRAFKHLLPLCEHHGLSSYDAAYLDLAIRRQLPLATLDAPLAKAARKSGVPIIG